MTQKELLYVEDAINHENNIISICSETVSLLEDDDLVSFIEKEANKHERMLEKLNNLLEEKSNE